MVPRVPICVSLFLKSYIIFKCKKQLTFCDNNNKAEEKVFLLGDERCLIKDTKQNGESLFFEKNKIKAKKITFGNCIGSCITENNDVYIWGSYDNDEKNEIVYVNPIKLNINEIFTDVQFSNNDIYLVNENGELKIIKNYNECLKNKKFIIEKFYKCQNYFSFPFFREKIIKLSVNKFHLAFVTNKGNMYCSGNNFYGQCAKEPFHKNNLNINYNFLYSNYLMNSFNMMSNVHTKWLQENVKSETDYVEDTYISKEYNLNSENNSYNEMNEYRGNETDKRNYNLSINNNHMIKFNKSDIHNNNDTITNLNNKNDNMEKYDDDKKDEYFTIKNGTDLFYKNNYVFMNKVPFEKKTKIVDVSCGLNHTLCLDDENNIYSFGDDSKIQLGLGESRTNKNSLAGTRWKDQLKHGYSIITKNLANYSFYDRHIQSSPQIILKKLNDKEIVGNIYKIVAGGEFSIIYSNDKFGKQLFCFGDNMYNQCGRHLGKHQQTLSTVKLSNHKINDISCGDRHCLLNLNDQLYGWGYNNKYQITPFKNKGIINNPIFTLSTKHYPNNAHIKYVNAVYNNSAIIITQK
ncbi:regulator of chromosome condensation, putative [Hepatocystis sp. ex Piliocolobus tephrosceles]|nr:regulator of chromosome condensation, putative [Hepatocystis sp. ex Piliocolobus tephrosceles]